MGRLPTLIENTYFFPLKHRRAADPGDRYFQARGDGLYPLTKDGDILRIQQTPVTDLHAGDLTLFERPSGQLAVHVVLTKRNRVNGGGGQVKPARLVGRVAAIERGGRTRRCDGRFARLAHINYFIARPLIRILLIVRRILLIIAPRFFVRDPESSLRFVAEKFNDAEEVLHYSQRTFEGLDAQERLLVEQFMGCSGRVLDIGCGAGREAFALAELGLDVVGIDVAPDMIAEAKRHAQTFRETIQFEVRSATALNYPSSSFDYVLISAGVYSHIPTRQLRIDMLRKINDLLTPDGIFFFSVLYRKHSLSRISIYDAFRKITKPILNERLHSEPGDALVRYVSPVGTPSKLCYVHFFKDPSEVLEEIALAGLDGFEDEKSGYWIVRPRSEAILREVAI